MNGINLAPILTAMTVIGLVPVIAVIATAFTKITIILLILRNAIGVQQTPPNIIVFSVAIVLTLHIMQPAMSAVFAQLPLDRLASMALPELLESLQRASEPMRKFLLDNSEPSSRKFFLNEVTRRSAGVAPTEADFAVIAPAFLMDELSRAFTAGLVLYIPFLIIDFAVGSILIALGMQMLSATAISTPLKILLFVQLDGWFKIVDALLLSYK